MAIKINTLKNFDPPSTPVEVVAPTATFSVVVGAGSPEDTVECLQTALEFAAPLGKVDFLVIDRCEDAETSRLLQSLGNDLAVVSVPEMPWATAWETAMSSAQQDFILLITADVRLEDRCLETLRNRLVSSQSLTAVSPAIDNSGRVVNSSAPQSGSGVCLLVSTERLRSGSFTVAAEPSATASISSTTSAVSMNAATSNAPMTTPVPSATATTTAGSALSPWMPHTPTITEKRKEAVASGHYGPVDCPMCGQIVTVDNVREDVRESGDCQSCGSWTRIRQLALVICSAFEKALGRPIRSIAELATIPGLTVYNMQASGSFHDMLGHMPGYQCSEYFDGGMASGTLVNGVMHQDAMDLSFADNTFDLVISTDVFEHVANPYTGFAELRRVLKPGGRHVFTVPFWDHMLLDVTRASMVNGNVVHHLEPRYHQDPVRNGALVFTDFGLEMIVKHGKVGYSKVNVYRIEDPLRGVFDVQPVFEAIY